MGLACWRLTTPGLVMREVLIRDLGKCINCDVCVDACRTRHGRARMTMTGPVFGRYQLPDVCRNCPDTPCVNACHLDGMNRHEGRTFVSDACRGCNKCVEACPYGVVILLPREHQKREGFFQRIIGQARSKSLRYRRFTTSRSAFAPPMAVRRKASSARTSVNPKDLPRPTLTSRSASASRSRQT